jgi:hypothetical protein
MAQPGRSDAYGQRQEPAQLQHVEHGERFGIRALADDRREQLEGVLGGQRFQ